MNASCDWWADFFSGLVVDFWRAAVPRAVTDAEVDFLWERLGIRPGSRVLDAPCGHGRHAVELAARGCRVTGIDYSTELLAAARDAAAARGVDASWERLDMRELLWEEEFDAAFCAGGSFAFFDREGDTRFLAGVGRALRPGGAFVLDASKVAESLLPSFREGYEMETGGVHFRAENRYDAERGRIENRYTMTREGRTETKLASHRVDTVVQVLDMLRSAKLEPVSLHGSTDGSPYRLASPQLFVVSRKAPAPGGGAP
ncbi:MAG: class I SAM-dependent methyltransferase [Acidobacteriota bacterium]